MMQDITERIWCDCTDKHCDYREAVEEIKRLRAGGCARDQGTTQYCAEAARLAAENERLRAALEGISCMSVIAFHQVRDDMWPHQIAARAALTPSQEPLT